MLSTTRAYRVLGFRRTAGTNPQHLFSPARHPRPAPSRELHRTRLLRSGNSSQNAPQSSADRIPFSFFFERLPNNSFTVSFAEKAKKYKKELEAVLIIIQLAWIGFVVWRTGYVLLPDAAPYTGRWRFIEAVFQSDLEHKRMKSICVARALGVGGEPLPKDHPVARRIFSICQRIVDANALGYLVALDGTYDDEKDVAGSTSADNQWRLFVVHGGNSYASCSEDDATLIFNTNTLPFVSDDDSIAGVIAHEIAHGLLKHSSETRAVNELYILAGGLFFFLRPLFAIPMMAIHVWRLTLPQRMEYEADRVGTLLLTRAGFHPRALIRFFQAVEEHQRLVTLDQLMDLLTRPIKPLFPVHPPRTARIKVLEEFIKTLPVDVPPTRASATIEAEHGPRPTIFSAFSGKVELSAISREEWEAHVKQLEPIVMTHLIVLAIIIGRRGTDVSTTRIMYERVKKSFERMSHRPRDYDPAFFVALLLGSELFKDYDHRVLKEAFQSVVLDASYSAEREYEALIESEAERARSGADAS
ncbi:unnamed protein product [Peniophora sp. CBMAI 1063]|nr:unnamed protein product [Peniophora sp. CBMAI 1063]